MLLMLVAAVAVTKAQTVLEVAEIPGESNYPFAQAVHTLSFADFSGAKQMMLLALKPPGGDTRVFEMAVKRSPDLTAPKFAEAHFKNNKFATITIKQYQNGQITTMVTLEGARIKRYSLSSENYTEGFVIDANRVWYEEPLNNYRVGYNFNRQAEMK
jgi:hypothetical protein